jgi:potassium/hydrogen antiporter
MIASFPSIDQTLLIAAVLVLLSLLSSSASNRLGIPALVLFLAVGMLAGSDGPGGIAFDNAWVAQLVGVVALVFILFSGGLDTDWQRIRPVLGVGLWLANVGVILSGGLVGLFAWLVLGFAPLEALLLGAVISSTDAAAVFAVMQSGGVNLKGDLEPLIELESGSNDPIAVFLTLGFTQLLVEPGATLLDLIPSLVSQMALGALCGFGFGRGMVWVLNRWRLQQEGLYSVLTLALVLFVYGVTTLIGGNGFLAVYLAGIVMGNRRFVHQRSLLRFHEGVAWLMQIVMFLTLGLLVFPSRLIPIIGPGLLLALFMIVVARPLSVFAALAWTRRFSLAEQWMVAWSGLRGAVPIVLATFPLLAGVASADRIFHLVFFVVLASVLVQGVSIARVARWLKLNNPTPVAQAHPLEYIPDVSVSSQLVEISVPAGAALAGRSLMDAALPDGVLVVLIRRGVETLVPHGGTVLEPDDRLLLLVKPELLAAVQSKLEPLPAMKQGN